MQHGNSAVIMQLASLNGGLIIEMQGLVHAMLRGYGLCIRNALANSEDLAASVSWDIVSSNEAFVTLYGQTG